MYLANGKRLEKIFLSLLTSSDESPDPLVLLRRLYGDQVHAALAAVVAPVEPVPLRGAQRRVVALPRHPVQVVAEAVVALPAHPCVKSKVVFEQQQANKKRSFDHSKCCHLLADLLADLLAHLLAQMQTGVPAGAVCGNHLLVPSILCSLKKCFSFSLS